VVFCWISGSPTCPAYQRASTQPASSTRHARNLTCPSLKSSTR
jgi:hypothetical protein